MSTSLPRPAGPFGDPDSPFDEPIPPGPLSDPLPPVEPDVGGRPPPEPLPGPDDPDTRPSDAPDASPAPGSGPGVPAP